MDNRSSPQISSFVLRFVQDDTGAVPVKRALRGSIRHIQSNQEVSFTDWADALAFMGQFIPPDTFCPDESSQDSG